MCGGHQPDHSTIGKFIVLPAAVLTEEFFVQLVKHLVARLRLGPARTAGDSTLIDAAARRFRLLWSEAAAQAAQAAREAAAAAPDNIRLKRKAALACAAAELGAPRRRRRCWMAVCGRRWLNKTSTCCARRDAPPAMASGKALVAAGQVRQARLPL